MASTYRKAPACSASPFVGHQWDPSFCTSSCRPFKNSAVTAFRSDVATQTAMGNNRYATSHLPKSCMVKPPTVIENRPSMDKKSSSRPLRAFQIKFSVDKQVKKLDLSSAMDSMKQYGESSSIPSSSTLFTSPPLAGF